MITLKAEKRQETRKKVSVLRKTGRIPAVLYGPNMKGAVLQVEENEFKQAYQQAGESSLIELELGGRKLPVLIHEIQRDPLEDSVIHIDFYQPPLDKKIEVTIPLVFKGEAPAVKELGGTLIEHCREIKVAALPADLPHEIAVSVDGLTTFEDLILVSDLVFPLGVEARRNAEDLVAQVVPAEDVEKELEKPVEEKVEEVKVVEKEKKEKEPAEQEQEQKQE